ncbi:hypothetical protein B0T14DRAFT_4153 [Immersiella caudata]|uniref:Uncharacterized protein n=1 Tax=Immersiella caudata TaxID=314043 RepID=A0AA40CBP9_9PEZI|nr:hypothetical protein B0T14DRAFT_4153 [Immersiella caudata]
MTSAQRRAAHSSLSELAGSMRSEIVKTTREKTSPGRRVVQRSWAVVRLPCRAVKGTSFSVVLVLCGARARQVRRVVAPDPLNRTTIAISVRSGMLAMTPASNLGIGRTSELTGMARGKHRPDVNPMTTRHQTGRMDATQALSTTRKILSRGAMLKGALDINPTLAAEDAHGCPRQARGTCLVSDVLWWTNASAGDAQGFGEAGSRERPM